MKDPRAPWPTWIPLRLERLSLVHTLQGNEFEEVSQQLLSSWLFPDNARARSPGILSAGLVSIMWHCPQLPRLAGEKAAWIQGWQSSQDHRGTRLEPPAALEAGKDPLPQMDSPTASARAS